MLTTPVRISKLKSRESSPLKLQKGYSLMDDDPDPDVRLDDDNVVNKPKVYITNSNSKSIIP